MEEPRRLGNRYELGAVLGRGGMAEVYMARDMRLGRTVAVKALRADMARDSTLQARFRREARSTASLNHPAVVAVYDTGEDYIDGVLLPYIVMEYVDGSTLRELSHSDRQLLPERAMEITTGILQALDYSHRNGIVHRDIKPANIMLNRSGAVKVMDFGIARAMGDSSMTLTQTSAVIGTAQYLSPEQAKGESIDARSDLYSTGCLLYELLTGRPPFIGDSPVAVAYQHVRETPLPPSHFDPEVPAVADTIVLKSLGKRPADRYQSADDMRADLERALDGRPLLGAPDLGPDTVEGAGPDELDEEFRRTDVMPTRSRRPSGEYTAPAQKPKNRKARTGYTIAGAVAVVAITVSAFAYAAADGATATTTSSTTTSEVVPNILSKSFGAAQTLVQNVKLQLAPSSDCSGNQANSLIVPSGEILSQKPASGAKMTSGSTVNYCMSSGAPIEQLFTQAALVNQTYQSVSTTLKSPSVGFTSVTEKLVTNPAAKGTVLDVTNTAGVSLLGQSVAVTVPLVIVVSAGPNTATVPGGLIGESCSSAANTIQNSSGMFQTTQVGQGYVTGTSPNGNATAPIGSLVTITCALPATTPPTVPPPTTPPTPTDTSTS